MAVRTLWHASRRDKLAESAIALHSFDRTAKPRTAFPWTPATQPLPSCGRSATSASSPTSTPARPPPPNASSITPARSTGWATWTRGHTTTDYLEEERERGITIVAAAITCKWKDARAADHDQHHRHARSRRLHRRGRAFAPRARRRGRRLLGRRRGRGAERDRLAAGDQVSRSPALLHQQDGPHRRRVRPGLRRDRRARSKATRSPSRSRSAPGPKGRWASSRG